MPRAYDVIVVGLGAMGSAAAYRLAAAGVRVLGLEQFDIPHSLGSSHGASRMIRLAYYEHPDYVPLLRRAYQLWDELESDFGQKLIHITGGLYMGPPSSEVLSGSIAAAQRYGIGHELLSHAELAAAYPQFTVPEDYTGMLDHAGGFVLPERAITAHCDLAMRQGAELHGREPVLEWRSTGSGVEVRTAAGTYAAAHLVFCGGAWSAKLVRDLGVSLVVTRQVMAWFWPPRDAETFDLGRFPVWAIDAPDVPFTYGFPIHPDGAAGLKIALHAIGPTTDADADPRQPTPADEAQLRPAIRRFLPAADGPLLGLRVCLYTNSPDHHFILARHPAHANVTLACGFSGHGFKFASVMGQAIADVAMKGRSELPIEFLNLRRFPTAG
jgi:sarcosine oxidase